MVGGGAGVGFDVVVEWIIIVREADLREFVFSLIFVIKMCVFVSRPMKIAIFPLKRGDFQRHIPKNILKSSRISSRKVTTTTTNPGNRG